MDSPSILFPVESVILKMRVVGFRGGLAGCTSVCSKGLQYKICFLVPILVPAQTINQSRKAAIGDGLMTIQLSGKNQRYSIAVVDWPGSGPSGRRACGRCMGGSGDGGWNSSVYRHPALARPDSESETTSGAFVYADWSSRQEGRRAAASIAVFTPRRLSCGGNSGAWVGLVVWYRAGGGSILGGDRRIGR